MDDPGLAWPAWKFGMKREDLTGSLNAQYNTFSWNIQDSEAFHHDVSDIANEAQSTEQFHQLMAGRRIQRLRELNESLESAAVEIVANPDLIGGGEKWDYALQVFRSRSLDSLIQFFASHLPASHTSPASSSSYSSFDDCTSIRTTSTSVSSVDDGSAFFDDHDLTDEPLPIKKSPTSLSSCSSSCDLVLDDDCPFPRGSNTDTANSSPVSSPTEEGRTFFGSDPEHFSHVDGDDEDDDDLVESRGPDTPITPLADPMEEHRELLGSFGTRCAATKQQSPVLDSGHVRVADDEDEHELYTIHGDDDDDDRAEATPASQQPPSDYFEVLDSDTPTPTPNNAAALSSYLDPHLCSSISRRHPSPNRASRHRCRGRREGSPLEGIRRGPQEPINRIQKPLPDQRLRPCIRRGQ